MEERFDYDGLLGVNSDLREQLADAQATVEALQAIIKQMGEQACVLAKDGMAAKAQVEALQRERDHAKNMAAVQKEVADNQTWHVRELTAALDAEREKVKGQTQRAEYAEGKVRELLLKQDALELKLSQLQALVRAFFTSEDKWAVAYRELERLGYTLDATPTERGHE